MRSFNLIVGFDVVAHRPVRYEKPISRGRLGRWVAKGLVIFSNDSIDRDNYL